MTDEQPIYAPFFGVMGATSAMVFSGKWILFSVAKVTRDLALSVHLC